MIPFLVASSLYICFHQLCLFLIVITVFLLHHFHRNLVINQQFWIDLPHCPLLFLRKVLFLFLYVILSLGSDKFKPFFNLSGYLFSFLMRYSNFSLKYSLEFSFAANYKGNSSLLVLYDIIILISDSHNGFSLLLNTIIRHFFAFHFFVIFISFLFAVPLLIHFTKGE